MVSGLGESLRIEWSGDVDMNDGQLQKLYTSYTAEIAFIKDLSCAERVKLQADTGADPGNGKEGFHCQ